MEKRLADYRVKEILLKVRLHQIRAEHAGRRLHRAEMNFGRARVTVTQSGYMQFFMPNGHLEHDNSMYPSLLSVYLVL